MDAKPQWKIYLDTNIFSGLYKVHNKEQVDDKYAILSELIGQNRSKLVFFYSEAHVKDQIDLGRQAQDEKTLDRLRFIGEFTNEYCLEYDSDDNEILIYIKDPTIRYAELKESYADLEDFDLSFLDKEMEELGLLPILDAIFLGMKDAFQTAYHENVQAFDSPGSTFQIMNDLYESSTNMSDFIKGMYHNSISILSEKDNLKSQLHTPLKNAINYYPDLKKVEVNNLNCKEFKLFLENIIKKNIYELNQEIIYNQYKDQGLYSEKIYYTNMYVIVDLFGYYQDNPKSKNKGMNNTVNDAEHCYYATVCDIFVSDDLKSTKKSQMVYDLLEHTNIRVYNTEEFISFLESLT